MYGLPRQWIENSGKVAVRTNCDLKSDTYASEKVFGREAWAAPHRICAIYEFRLYFRDIVIKITLMAIVRTGVFARI
jgi:hypothetical protein